MSLPFYRRIIRKIKWLSYGKPTIERHKKELKKKLKKRDFTIISSNCWGGFVYQYAEMEYLTPTIGLYFHAPCFIRFISDLKNNLAKEITFVTASKYDTANEFRKSEKRYYPIGMLGDDIEIHFLHYKSAEEAVEKWNNRKKRINYDHLIFSFCDKFCCTPEEIKAFDDMDLDKKVFFTHKPLPGIASSVYLPSWRKKGEVGGADEIVADVISNFDIISLLNR